MMKSCNIELLSKETTRLLGLQINTLNEALNTTNFLNTAPPASGSKEKQETRAEKVKAWISNLENEQQKLDKLEMVLAVIGTMKAGKSTTINKSLDSAIKKLAYYNNEFLNILNLHSNAMTKDIREIEQMRQNLENDINRCELVKKDVKKTTNTCLSELEQGMGVVMNAQQDNILETIEKFFKEGKRIEKSMADKMMQAALKKRAENPNLRNVLRNFLTAGKYEQQRSKHIEGKINQRFNPNPDSRKINFGSNANEANKLTKEITDDVIAGIFKDADEILNSTTNALIKEMTQSIAQQIDEAVADTLKKAQEKLKNDGIALNFRLPDIDLTIDDVDASALFKAGYNEKNETERRSRRKSGVWGGVCSFFGTNDWGWEDYKFNVTTYIVDLEKIKAQVIGQLNNQARQLSNQTSDYLRNIFQPNIDKHLVELVRYLTSYSRVLDDAIKSSELNETSKTELKKQLELLLKTQEILKGDIEVLDEAIQ